MSFAKSKSLMCNGLRITRDFRISAYFALPYATFLFHSAAQARWWGRRKIGGATANVAA